MVFKWFHFDQWNKNTINLRLFSSWIMSFLGNTHLFAMHYIPTIQRTVLRCFQVQVENVIKHEIFNYFI